MPPRAIDEIYGDAVLGGALSAAHTAIDLWRAGVSVGSPSARRALSAFQTCRRATARLPGGDDVQVRRAQIAVASLADELSMWAITPNLSPEHERVLLSQAGALQASSGAGTLWELQLPFA